MVDFCGRESASKEWQTVSMSNIHYHCKIITVLWVRRGHRHTYSHVLLRILATLVLKKDCSNCSRFTISGSPSSFHRFENMLKTFPLSASLGPTCITSVRWQFFPPPLPQWSISISIIGFFVFQSNRSRNKFFKARKFFHGSRETELHSISFAISSKQASWCWCCSSRLESDTFFRFGSSFPKPSTSNSSQKPVDVDTGLIVCVEPNAAPATVELARAFTRGGCSYT